MSPHGLGCSCEHPSSPGELGVIPAADWTASLTRLETMGLGAFQLQEAPEGGGWALLDTLAHWPGGYFRESRHCARRYSRAFGWLSLKSSDRTDRPGRRTRRASEVRLPCGFVV